MCRYKSTQVTANITGAERKACTEWSYGYSQWKSRSIFYFLHGF